MEPNNKSGTDRNSRVNYSENSASSRDGPSANNGGQWHETRRDQLRDDGKKRERSRDLDRSDRSFHGKTGNSREERFNQEQPQQLSQQFTSYSFIDNNRHSFSVPNYALIGMNSQWNVNPMDSMTMQANMPVNPGPTAMPGTSGMKISQTTNPAMNHPYTVMNMPVGNMYGVMGNFCQLGMMNSQENMVGPVKEVIQLSQCVLYPPNPKAPSPTISNKPLGCRTVRVGGLPEKATEEIVKEIFGRCGDIAKIRMSEKNLCHIKFANEALVDTALYFSGYNIKIGNKSDLPYTGNLHVDYAMTRDDQIESQQGVDLEAKHLQQIEEGLFKASTVPIVHYSEDEAALLKEKIRDEETFQQSVNTLILWLEKGDCNKRNSNSFYSMIQSANSHVRRLMNEKLKYEDELNKAKSMLMKQIQETLIQFKEIEKVFRAASLQKVWDHFTKAQRRNIDLWKKKTEETKCAHLAELLNDRIEDEMVISEDEEESKMKTCDISEQQKTKLKERNKLKEENDALRCQLEAAENEKMVLKTETARELDLKERQIQLLEHASQNASKQLLNDKRSAQYNEVHALKAKGNIESDNNDHSDIMNPVCIGFSDIDSIQKKGALISLVSTFLNVHPFGASIDYILSYLHQFDNTIELRYVENVMKCYPTLFREDSTGIGASLGKKWRFLGLQS